MMELLHVRDSYETRGADPPARFEDAHRLLRMALAVAHIVPVPHALFDAALEAYDRAVAFDGVTGERRFTVDEVAVLAEVLAHVRAQLDEGLDQEWRPRGPVGGAIREEATRPKVFESGEVDSDRVFEIDDEGRVGTLYPRMSLVALTEDLPRLVQFFRDAAARKLEVAIVD